MGLLLPSSSQELWAQIIKTFLLRLNSKTLRLVSAMFILSSDDVYHLLEVHLLQQFVSNVLLCRIVDAKPVVISEVFRGPIKVLHPINTQIVGAASNDLHSVQDS